MVALILFLTCLFVAVAIGGMAAWSDIKGLVIPNWHSGVIIVSFFAAFGFMHLLGHPQIFGSILSHLTAALIIFAITATLFGLKTIGAADSKLCTAYAFWAGVAGLPAFLFYMSVVGGLVGLWAIALQKWQPVKSPAPGGWVARVQAGENKVPYGVAIVVGALASFVKLGYFNGAILTLLGHS
ncbi:MAG TPA: prepilin peptidase [Alphaproteobacteria bacterium]|jgi:Flp pilus assembly protein protease CpaA|nr:prepilin peptidase [Micavibrio sp.]MBK9562798.1 prepilin peptidase [Micavibrio sp.]HQX28317.1 prepilin peptidase [Alphaproteobacteria bacterium]